MKIKDPEYKPTFNYFGNELPRIPGWYATDSNGMVFRFKCKPFAFNGRWIIDQNEVCEFICTVDLGVVSWSETLVEVK